ncbi:unnamed protein product [Amoebophrya sp. A25]|nr:unnamed protein product [Amoebophrya sp. A25]|eukprot:GSA25T00011921001.1
MSSNKPCWIREVYVELTVRLLERNGLKIPDLSEQFVDEIVQNMPAMDGFVGDGSGSSADEETATTQNVDCEDYGDTDARGRPAFSPRSGSSCSKSGTIGGSSSSRSGRTGEGIRKGVVDDPEFELHFRVLRMALMARSAAFLRQSSTSTSNFSEDLKRRWRKFVLNNIVDQAADPSLFPFAMRGSIEDVIAERESAILELRESIATLESEQEPTSVCASGGRGREQRHLQLPPDAQDLLNGLILDAEAAARQQVFAARLQQDSEMWHALRRREGLPAGETLPEKIRISRLESLYHALLVATMFLPHLEVDEKKQDMELKQHALVLGMTANLTATDSQPGGKAGAVVTDDHPDSPIMREWRTPRKLAVG